MRKDMATSIRALLFCLFFLWNFVQKDLYEGGRSFIAMNQKKPGKGWLSFLWNSILITGVAAVGLPAVAWVGLSLWGVFVRRPPVNPTTPPGSSSTLESPTDNPSEGNSTSLVEGPTPETRLENTSEEEGFPVAVLDWQQQKELLAKKLEESLIRSAELECELEEHVKRGSSEDEISQVLQALTKEQNYRKTENLEDSLLSQDEIEDLERDHLEVKARTIAKARASAARRAKHARRITIRLRRLRASSSRNMALRSNQSPASSDSESLRISAGEEESGHE